MFCSMISDPEDRAQTQSLPQSAHDTEQMQRPGTSSKHTAETAEVDPVADAEENAPDVLPRLCQQ